MENTNKQTTQDSWVETKLNQVQQVAQYYVACGAQKNLVTI